MDFLSKWFDVPSNGHYRLVEPTFWFSVKCCDVSFDGVTFIWYGINIFTVAGGTLCMAALCCRDESMSGIFMGPMGPIGIPWEWELII